MTKDTSTNPELESHLHGQGETVAAGVSAIDNAILELEALDAERFTQDPKRAFGAVAEAKFLLKRLSAPAGVSVKALEWTDPRGDGSRWAKDPCGGWVVATQNGWGNRNFPEQFKVDGGLDEAMRAAESNHRAVILSSIDTAGLAENWIAAAMAHMSKTGRLNLTWGDLAALSSAIGGEAEPVAWRDVLRRARDMLGRSGDGPYIEIERAVGNPIIDFIEDELDTLYLARQGGVK